VIAGTTLEQGPEQPLAGVRIVAEAGDETVRVESDEAGRFQMRLPRGGTWTVRAGRLGYLAIDPVEVEVPDEGGRTLTIRLRTEPILLETLEVQARRSQLDPLHRDTFEGFLHRYAARESRTVYAARRGDPEMESANHLVDILRWFPPPRRQMSWPDTLGGEIFIDGRPAFPGEVEFIAAEDVEGIEYYRDPFGAPIGIPIGPDAGPGTPVILIWTRRPGRDLVPLPSRPPGEGGG
jgi:hypothetical protein